MNKFDPIDLAAQAVALKTQCPDYGYIHIAKTIGWDKNRVRRAIEHAQRKNLVPLTQSAAVIAAPGTFSRYETARQALAAAKTLDDVKDIRDKAEAMRIYGRMAKDHDLEADAAEIRLRAERKLGDMIAAEKAIGGIARGNRSKCADSEQFAPIKLEDLDIDRKLSSRAQKVHALDEPTFEHCLSRLRERITQGDRVSLDIASQTKAERRAIRERVLGGIQCALPAAKYGVIVADPEWQFNAYSAETGMDRAADNHYPTSTTAAIAARDVPSIAADDCVLFLWATGPMLNDALCVMEHWGVAYKSQAVWYKQRQLGVPAVGTGYWFRNCHELLLVGTKGNIPAPAPGTQGNSVLVALTGAHSAKPEVVLELIESWYPTLPKIELNRRGPARPGWASWGLEAEAAE